MIKAVEFQNRKLQVRVLSPLPNIDVLRKPCELYARFSPYLNIFNIMENDINIEQVYNLYIVLS